MLLPCIICGAVLKPAMPRPVSEHFGVVNQPYGGTTFRSNGQYGSTVFDEMGRSFIEVTICDPCLTARHMHVLHYVPVRYREPVYDITTWQPPAAGRSEDERPHDNT